MGAMTNFGGRKFLISLVVLGIAIFLELHSDKGLTTTMAGFMIALVGTFHAANSMCTATYAKNPKSGNDAGPLHRKLDTLSEKMTEQFAPERTEQLKQLFTEMQKGIQQNQVLTAQVAQTLLNLGNKK